jgi:hypothetical protein
MRCITVPKIGISKAPKTLTISLNNLVWLDEYCIKKGVKVSTFVDKLINEKRQEDAVLVSAVKNYQV